MIGVKSCQGTEYSTTVKRAALKEIDVSEDIDNPGNFYCVKCWEAYDADIAYHHGIHLVKENRLLSTQNTALAVTVANVLAGMDKMKECMEKMKDRADRHWKETSCLEQKISGIP
jgi:hypothetical protein